MTLPRFAAAQRHYTAHIRPRGEDRANAGSSDPQKQPRRWVVEQLPLAQPVAPPAGALGEATYEASPSSASNSVTAYERRLFFPNKA